MKREPTYEYLSIEQQQLQRAVEILETLLAETVVLSEDPPRDEPIAGRD